MITKQTFPVHQEKLRTAATTQVMEHKHKQAHAGFGQAGEHTPSRPSLVLLLPSEADLGHALGQGLSLLPSLKAHPKSHTGKGPQQESSVAALQSEKDHTTDTH